MKWFRLFLLTLFVCLPGTALAAAPSPSTVVIEAVRGEGEDSKAARLDAFRNAIAQAVGMYVRADTLVENYVTRSDKIRTNATGFIKSFKKLNESVDEGIVIATYRVEVATAPLNADLKAVVGHEFRNVGHPTVAVVGWYKGRDRLENELNQTAVAALNRALIQRGYKVIDPYQIALLRQNSPELEQRLERVERSAFHQVAQDISKRLKADIYVTTYGSVSQGRASVATKMYNSYTAQILGSETGYASFPAATPAYKKLAIDKAVTQSMQSLLNQVSQHWQDVLTHGLQYHIVLEGYTSGKQRRSFSAALKESSGVVSVRQIAAAGGRAEFHVYSSSSPLELFDSIFEAAEPKGLRFLEDEAVVRGGRAVFILAQ